MNLQMLRQRFTDPPPRRACSGPGFSPDFVPPVSTSSGYLGLTECQFIWGGVGNRWMDAVTETHFPTSCCLPSPEMLRAPRNVTAPIAGKVRVTDVN